jgi:hypothetical protein
MKRCSILLVIMEMKSKIMGYSYPLDFLQLKRQHTKSSLGCGATGTLMHCGKNVKWYNHLW